jgi:3'-phosphoadenosine 5'-phosphosulfate synthase
MPINGVRHDEKPEFNLKINLVEMQWVQVLAEGWAHPLTGFMNEDEYLECMHFKSITKNGKSSFSSSQRTPYIF